MFKKYVYYTSFLLICLVVFFSCKKWDDYKKYTDGGEIPYPAAASDVIAAPGNERVLLTWIHGIDSRIKNYQVFWNNGNDSISVEAKSFKTGDTVKCFINQIPESTYTFSIYSLDDIGNKSVATELSSINVYGLKYKNTLLNRAVQHVDYDSETNMLTVKWGTADTINLGTEIRYTDAMGNAKKMQVTAEDETSIFSWKIGSKIYYISSYKPVASAIDSFMANHEDSITVRNIQVPKDNWKKVDLPNDIEGNAYGTKFESIWDGQLGSYPNIYHTQGGSLPHHFTIDLGALYQLTMFEESGRQDCACHNPVEWEVWGIPDITNAATTLPGADPGWKDESLAKGWILLKKVVRNDDGKAPFKVSLPEDSPNIRYIRIRVLKTLDNSIESHMGEISFWYNP